MQQLETFVEAVRAQLLAAGLCSGNVIKTPYTPSRDEQLPQARVFVGHDDGRPHGNPRTGYVKLDHTSQLVVEIIAKGNTGVDLKAALCGYAELVMTSLMRDQSWGGQVLEGIGGVRQIYDQPVEGNHVLGRVQVQIDALWRSEWIPGAPADAFQSTGVTVANLGVRSEITQPQ